MSWTRGNQELLTNFKDMLEFAKVASGPGHIYGNFEEIWRQYIEALRRSFYSLGQKLRESVKCKQMFHRYTFFHPAYLDLVTVSLR